MTASATSRLARTLPSTWYYGDEIYQRERQAIFGQSWLVVGHATELAASGNYLATDLAGWGVLILVDDAGQLRGFHNVCRHRAGPLVWDGAGHCSALVCRYHGWVYDLDGRLRSARDFGAGAEPDTCNLALAPVRVACWRSLIWVNLDQDAPPLETSLGDFTSACESYPMEDLRFGHETVHDLDVNWKTYADNYLEGYHIPLVHRELNREIDATRYRVEVGNHWCRHEAPTRAGAVNAGRWLWRWPNLALNLYPNSMNVERFLPLGPRRTRVSYRYFTADGSADPEVVRMSTQVLDEDRRICEAVQRNLESGAYIDGVLSPRHEPAVAAFQGWVRKAVEAR